MLSDTGAGEREAIPQSATVSVSDRVRCVSPPVSTPAFCLLPWEVSFDEDTDAAVCNCEVRRFQSPQLHIIVLRRLHGLVQSHHLDGVEGCVQEIHEGQTSSTMQLVLKRSLKGGLILPDGTQVPKHLFTPMGSARDDFHLLPAGR